MNIKSFGCSFIYGSELSDEAVAPGFAASKLTWPALMAQQLGANYSCHAQAGTGNLSILERIIEQSVTATPDDVFVIGWTWIDRFDYFDGSCDPAVGPTARNSNDYNIKWKTVLPAHDTEESKFYYKKFHSEYQDKLTSLIYIRSAIDLLKQKKIPFIMTYIDNLMFDTKWNINDTVRDLQDYIKPWITTFNNLTFLEWSTAQGYPISAGLHPLEKAHSKAADLMLSELDKDLKDPSSLTYRARLINSR